MDTLFLDKSKEIPEINVGDNDQETEKQETEEIDTTKVEKDENQNEPESVGSVEED